MRPQGENFLAGLVDTLSQTCGWEDITSRECMMVSLIQNTILKIEINVGR
jgi:hypothetical protein